jgi:hypothetical protein
MTTPVQPPKHPQLTCEQAQDVIFNLQERQPVSDAMKGDLLEHLAQCPACQAYQNDLACVSASMSALEAVDVPVGLAERIMAQIAEIETTAAPATLVSSQRFLWKKYTPMAAAVLILAIATPLLMPNSPVSLTRPTASTLQAEAQRTEDFEATGATASTAAAEIDETQLAQGGSPLKIGLKQTYASETESDMYYDPVSTLVGF